jgi:hypothetical protein
VEKRQDPAFRQALQAEGVKATVVGETGGIDYSTGKSVDLLLYRSDSPAPSKPAPSAAPQNAKPEPESEKQPSGFI